MVSRKPPSSNARLTQRLDSSAPQEFDPTTAAQHPLSFENQQQGHLGHEAGISDMNTDELESTRAWTGVPTSDPLQKDPVPASLRPGVAASNPNLPESRKLPPSLQAGSAELTPRSSWESERGRKPEAQNVGSSTNAQDSIRTSVSPASTNPFRRPHEPVPGLAAPGMSQYGEVSNANPWSTELSKPSIPLPQNLLDDDQDIWNKLPPSPPKKPATLAEPEVQYDTLSDQQEDPSQSNDQWREHATALGASPIPNYTRAGDSFAGSVETAVPPPQNSDNQGAMAETGQQQEQLRDSSPYELDPRGSSTFVGTPGPSALPQQLLETPAPSHGVPGPSASPQQLLETPPPALPPPQPPRPSQSNAPAADDPGHDRPVSQAKQAKPNETYQIRLVTWVDESSTTDPRRSPIMVQNANGPCPLLALVNALVLSTPATTTTPLVETLRVREQVSLGLLLDAVIDELMSGRRGDAAQNLPDVSDLYAFLTNLHTGMNVNPRFIAFEEPVNLMDAPIDTPSRAHDYRRPGGFEQTREMNLYSTFAIPLIHGWIPPVSHPAFTSLKRVAPTYEDAQNILFREEELEDKLRIQGLSPEEQVTLQDIASIKYFLSSTATQLTGYGLDTVTESLAPGSLAILFRNDHFSTLYRHPRSGQLLTLVTDMGYAGHDEVVWESLVDVSGEGSEFYSGDFRPVGNIPQDVQQQNGVTNTADDEGWETVPTRPRRTPQGDTGLPHLDTLTLNNTNANPNPTSTEQEDHDLALAMQLQEEEEERQRRSNADRRREDELSQAYLNNADASGRRTFPGFGRGATSGSGSIGGGGGGGVGGGGGGTRPNVPPRGGSTTNRGARPVGATTHRPAEASEDNPPPSYEQAAKTPTYHPPAGHPAYSPSPLPAGGPRPLPPRPRRGSSAYAENAAVAGQGAPSFPRGRGRGGAADAPGPGLGRRRTGEVAGEGGDEIRRERDCVVM